MNIFITKITKYDFNKKFLWDDMIKEYLITEKLPDNENSNYRTMDITKTSALTSAASGPPQPVSRQRESMAAKRDLVFI